LGIDDYSIYRELPWSQDGVIYNDEKERFTPDKQVTTQN
jgi:hypothetical protein